MLLNMSMKSSYSELQKKVILGIELEGYTILTPSCEISRKMAFHRKGVSEKGERFGRDATIGTEYNSRPFSTIREGFFLIKSGLRKYNLSYYRRKTKSKKSRQIFLVGGWRDRFAGTHAHLSLAGTRLDVKTARRIASHIHDHIPLLIAITANSPVWADEITDLSSNRVLKGSKKYCKPIGRNGLTSGEFNEITFSAGRKTKPPTLEVRVMDSNIPEFVMASASILKACVLGFLMKKPQTNHITHYQYLKSRQDAAKRGMNARLCWNGEWLDAKDYLDRFVWTYRDEFKIMDIPQEIWMTFKLLKKGINASRILFKVAQNAYKEHPKTWQKHFAKKYLMGINSLLGGNSLLEFMYHLELDAPNLSNVWLGRRKLKLL